MFAVATATLALSPLWTRPQGLMLANHPLIVQLGTGALPMGSFNRCLLAREALLEGLEASAASSCSGDAVSPEAAQLLSMAADESARCTRDASLWLETAAGAGRSIELPAEEVAAGVRCYTCGGTHYNIDCPETAAAPPEALALAGFLKSARTLAAASAVLRDLSFASNTLLKAGLTGGDAYSACVAAHAQRCGELADACDRTLAAAGTLEDTASDSARLALDETRLARSLLFALVDSECGTAGLKDSSCGDGDGGMSLREAREAIEAVEPGFLQEQDRNAAFLRETLLQPSDTPNSDAPAAAAGPTSAARRQEQRVDAAAAYLKAKQAAARQPIAKEAASTLQDAKAAALASRPGPQQGAAKRFVEVRKKQQAAAAYLARKKQQQQQCQQQADEKDTE